MTHLYIQVCLGGLRRYHKKRKLTEGQWEEDKQYMWSGDQPEWEPEETWEMARVRPHRRASYVADSKVSVLDSTRG